MSNAPLDSARFHKLSGGDPESFTSQFFVLLEEVVKQRGSNGDKDLAVVPGVDHLVHYNEMASAFERLTTLVQAQQKALIKLDENDDKILRKVNLYVEGQTQYKLAKWFWWAIGGCLALLIGLAFLAGIFYTSHQADARIDRIISALQPNAAQASASLASHGGSISLGPVTLADGSRGRAIIVTRGTLKQTEATDGAILLTLP